MPRFLIRREVPGAGQMDDAQLAAISQRSNDVLHRLQRDGVHIQWDHCYVTDDTLHCVYIAPNADAVRAHARDGGLACNEIMSVRGMISPITGE